MRSNALKLSMPQVLDRIIDQITGVLVINGEVARRTRNQGKRNRRITMLRVLASIDVGGNQKVLGKQDHSLSSLSRVWPQAI